MQKLKEWICTVCKLTFRSDHPDPRCPKCDSGYVLSNEPIFKVPMEKPATLVAKPNIAFEAQTLEQLKAERDYWIKVVETASGCASAYAADSFRRGAEAWIKRREADQQS